MTTRTGGEREGEDRRPEDLAAPPEAPAAPAGSDAAAAAGGNPVPPEACRTMAEVRAGVDALDRRLVALLSERQRFMDAAARIKTERGRVRDVARIEEVVGRVLGEARAQGLSDAIAEPLWRLLIDRCIAYELQVFDRRRGAEAPSEAGSA